VNPETSILHSVDSNTGEHMVTSKSYQPPETEWQKDVKTRKQEGFYQNLQQVEEQQLLKEIRDRENKHQFDIPGMKNASEKGVATDYEKKLAIRSAMKREAKNQQPAWALNQKAKIQQQAVAPGAIFQAGQKEVVSDKPEWAKNPPKLKATDRSASSEESKSEVHIDSAKGGVLPGPTESSVHAKEVHTSQQKQTQKEQRGDTEVTRKITATETTELEHKGQTREQVVKGPVKPSTPPFFTSKIQPCRVFETESARFEVTFDGEPTPVIKWFREDFQITSSPDFQIHTFGDKSVLIIREVFMEDSGVFAAIAENRGGSAKCSANLVVEEKKQKEAGKVIPPNFTSTIQDIAVKQGGLVRFDAKISGTKPHEVYWLKNGKKVKENKKYKMVVEGDQYTLIILECSPADVARYECVAINQAGEARCEGDVTIAGGASSTSTASASASSAEVKGAATAPTIIEKMKALIVNEGQSATFSCLINAQPAPQVQWFKDDKKIKPSKYFQMTSEGQEQKLHITEAFPEDEGMYKLIATNSAGKLTLSAPLKVLIPEDEDTSPEVTPLQAVTVIEGQPATFTCHVNKGSPPPTVQWYREGALIPQSRDFNMTVDSGKATLTINMTYPEDTGKFTCRVTNPAGQVETSAPLTVKSKK